LIELGQGLGASAIDRLERLEDLKADLAILVREHPLQGRPRVRGADLTERSGRARANVRGRVKERRNKIAPHDLPVSSEAGAPNRGRAHALVFVAQAVAQTANAVGVASVTHALDERLADRRL
jgi:hypothetical protein